MMSETAELISVNDSKRRVFEEELQPISLRNDPIMFMFRGVETLHYEGLRLSSSSVFLL